MKLSDLPNDVFWATPDSVSVSNVDATEVQVIGFDEIARPYRPATNSPVRVTWFANWQRAATFTLDIEIDWGTPLFMVEFVFGIGFQVGFALLVMRR